MKKRKNPIRALILSIIVFPGTGQIYNKEYIKGILVLVTFSILAFFSFKPIVWGYIDYLNTVANIENIEY